MICILNGIIDGRKKCAIIYDNGMGAAALSGYRESLFEAKREALNSLKNALFETDKIIAPETKETYRSRKERLNNP